MMIKDWAMPSNWNHLASNILKAELKRKAISYEQLKEKLAMIGIDETINSIKNKIGRGTFQFAFFLQCATAIGIKNLHLEGLAEI
jgi:hypothetical protein